MRPALVLLVALGLGACCMEPSGGGPTAWASPSPSPRPPGAGVGGPMTPPPPAPPPAAPPTPGTIGLGPGVPIARPGDGEPTPPTSGSGVSVATGGPGSSSGTPTVRTGEATTMGSLSREVIRRVVRRHIDEMRSCYEAELRTNPSLAGRVAVEWVVSSTGAVASASLGSSTLGSAAAEACMVDAVRRWTFPAPEGGGIVRVTYPFVFSAAP